MTLVGTCIWCGAEGDKKFMVGHLKREHSMRPKDARATWRKMKKGQRVTTSSEAGTVKVTTYLGSYGPKRMEA